MTGVAAIILAGGGGRRLGGVDKASIRIGDGSLLEHALAAAAGCDHIVVVGPTVQGLTVQGLTVQGRAVQSHGTVAFAREDPPGGGPVAGIAAGLHALDGTVERVLVLACDMPYAGRAIPALLAATENNGAQDGAWGLDTEGRAQPLCAVYRRDALERAVDALGDPAGVSMRGLTASLTLEEVPIGQAARDADTWDDVRALRKERG